MAESRVATLEGNDLADDYVRTHVPKGAWGDTWDLFKSNYLKFVIINVITLLFFVPAILLVIFKGNLTQQLGSLHPFSSNALFLYPLTPNMQGVQENLVLTVDMFFTSLLVIAGFIASVGVAGACYSIKRLINTHGQFTIQGYFHGVRKCYFNVALPFTVFMIFVFGCVSVFDWASLEIAMGGAKGGPVTAQVFIIIATVIIGVIGLWVLAVGVSYKVKFKYLIKNSLVLLVGTILQSLLMIGFAFIPVWILLIGEAVTFFRYLGYIVFVFIGFSFIILCWMSYTQWVFDMFITPAVKNEEEVRKAKLTPKQLAAEKEEEEKAIAREILAAGRSELVGRPMRPIDGGTQVKEIGVAYGRSDISRVSGERGKIKQEVDTYYDEHKGDTRYAEYEKLFAERERALSTTDKKGKKKKLGRNNLLTK